MTSTSTDFSTRVSASHTPVRPGGRYRAYVAALGIVALGAGVFSWDGWLSLMTAADLSLPWLAAIVLDVYIFVGMAKALDPTAGPRLRRYAWWTSLLTMAVSAAGSAIGHFIQAQHIDQIGWMAAVVVPVVLTALFAASAHLISLIRSDTGNHDAGTQDGRVRRVGKARSPGRTTGTARQSSAAIAKDADGPADSVPSTAGGRSRQSRAPHGDVTSDVAAGEVVQIGRHRGRGNRSVRGEKAPLVKAYRDRVIAAEGREPGTAEISRETGVSDRTVRDVVAKLRADDDPAEGRTSDETAATAGDQTGSARREVST
ncbi:hypothetical protein ABN028_15970 [Actinopolymorpha sp. B17G11]|uniref:hypothetical protein n=1 Tax=Actinopolymorpha sp. B17G11 TaxID=3160861 RepID=UPI0032E5146C